MISVPSIRGRGRARARNKTDRGRGGRPGNTGSVTSGSSRTTTSSVQLVSFKETIPDAARLPTENDKPLWVNHKGQVKARTVVGEKVFIRAQPPVPPKEQEILLLTDQMMEGYPEPDKYI